MERNIRLYSIHHRGSHSDKHRHRSRPRIQMHEEEISERQNQGTNAGAKGGVFLICGNEPFRNEQPPPPHCASLIRKNNIIAHLHKH